MENKASRESITERELQVMQLVAVGKGNKEIGEQLNISPETVKKHLKSVYRKLNARNRIEAMLKLQGQLTPKG